MANNLDKLIEQVQGNNFPLSDKNFNKSVDELIEKIYFDDSKYSNVEVSFKDLLGKLDITDDEERQLVNLQKLSPFMDDEESAKKFLPIALYQIRNRKVDYSSLSSLDGGDLDSSVEYYFANSSQETRDFVRDNIEFAAQLYYVMVIGDELELFNAADALTTIHMRSKRYSVDVKSRSTLDAVRLYTHSERFEDIETGKTYQRTLEAERMMCYKQVFDMGVDPNMADTEANPDFIPLWEELMIQVTQYIQKIEESTYSEYISRNNIYQAIEDLQYNLSNNCTGLAKITSNVMNLETQFIIKKLFDDQDIKDQVGKKDRTVFGVLKQILTDLNGERGIRMQNIIALNNKATFGHKIIMDIAKFSPGYMETGNNFAAFITNVQAYFLAQKIIEKQNANEFNAPGFNPGDYTPGQYVPDNIRNGTRMPVNDEFDF